MRKSIFRHLNTPPFFTHQQVEVEIHETLLKYDGLIEPAATNQGAWLTESAGALSVLHSAVLTSLTGFSVDKGSIPASYGSALSAEKSEAEAEAQAQAQAQAEAQAGRPGTELSYGGEPVRGSARGGDPGEDLRRTIFPREGDGSELADEVVISGAEGTALCDVNTSVGCSGGDPRGGASTMTPTSATTAAATTVPGCSTMHMEEQRDQRRARLQNLGLLLARRRKFTASRQVCFVLAVLLSIGAHDVDPKPHACVYAL